jgi:hypothetical protein
MPRKRLDKPLGDGQVEQLAALGLSDSEIAGLLGRCEAWAKLHYRSALSRGRARLRLSLRRAQIRCALAGNPSLLIFLGKNYLRQSDRQSLDVSAEHRALAITPHILERLQTSYKLTMEQLRTCDSLPAATEEGGPSYVAGDGSKQRSVSVTARIFNCGALSDDSEL